MHFELEISAADDGTIKLVMFRLGVDAVPRSSVWGLQKPVQAHRVRSETNDFTVWLTTIEGTAELGALGSPFFAYFLWRRKESKSPSRTATVNHRAAGT